MLHERRPIIEHVHLVAEVHVPCTARELEHGSKAAMKHKPQHAELIEAALQEFQRTTGLTAQIIPWVPKTIDLDRHQPDAVIEIEVRGRKHKFAVEAKIGVRAELLIQTKALWPREQQPRFLVVAPYITNYLAEKCREIKLPFLDAAGNAYLEDDDLFVFVTGQKRNTDLTPVHTNRTDTRAGLRVLFAILCRPQLLNAPYRELATTAKVALGTIGPVIKDLETRRRIATFGTTLPKRRLLDAKVLLQEWVTFYPATLRPKLQPRRFRAQNRERAQQTNLTPFGAYWGGEVAADRLTHYLKPEILTVYTLHNPTKLMTEFRLRADVNGDVEILNAFWDETLITGTADVVPPILAYADLMATTDARNLEAARLIYEQHIAPNLSTA